MAQTNSGRFAKNGNIIIGVNTKQVPQMGMGEYLFEAMTKNKDSIGQIDGITGENDTYGSMLQRSIRTAIAMRSKGITQEDIVTVCSHNHLNTYIPLIASYFLGAKTANTDPTMSLIDTVQLLKQVRPKIIFVSPEGVELIEKFLQETGITAEIVVFGQSVKHAQFSEFLQPSPEEKNFAPLKISNTKETAVIFFSSGSSGLPKGICLSHETILSQMIPIPSSLDLPPLVLMSYTNPYWITSLVWLMSNLLNNGSRIIAPQFDPVAIWDLIEKYKASMLFLTPSQVTTMLNYGPGSRNMTSVMMITATGSPFSVEQIRDAQKAFPTAIISGAFGQTETAGAALFFNPSYLEEDMIFLMERPASCGRPMAGFSYKIVNPETEEILGSNQRGELRLKSEYPMNGYYNMDSSSAWDADGFIKTGDVGYYDEDYCFYVVDRIKEMLKFQGWQIAPAMLEGILATHPAVESAVVIGLPHPVDGDHAMGVVTLNKTFTGTVTPEEIEKYVAEKVSDKQRLRGGVKIVDHIPVTPSGKLVKRYIKELALQGQL